MKVLTALLLSAFALPSAFAQMPARHSENAPLPAEATANPVVWSANQIYSRQAKYMVAAAEEMPESKYTYKPTPEQRTFAGIVSHVAQSNGGLCSVLSGTPPPPALRVPATASKADLVAAIKASFDYCNPIMANLTDAKLSDLVSFRRTQLPRARALIEIVGDLEDHYSQMAAYLRLNGMLPPSAAPRK